METNSPYWSVMIPTFNRPCVAEAIRSVLAQDPGPDHMHIEVVDNCSTALDVEALVRHEGRGRVAFHRNPQNLGMIPNWNTCISRAKGQWVHILHDDDLVYDGFYHTMQAAAQSAPSIAAAFCSARLIDSHGRQITPHSLERPQPGIYPDLLRRLLLGNAIQFASIVVRRSIYEQLGNFDPAIDYVADWDMWMRLAAKFPVWYEPQTLAAYRQHENSETSAITRSGRERRGYAFAADRWLHYAGASPENLALHARQKESFATDGLHIAAASFTRGDFYAGLHQLRAALDCSAAPAVLHNARKFLPHLLTHAPLDPVNRRQLIDLAPPEPNSPTADDPAPWLKMLDFLAKNMPY